MSAVFLVQLRPLPNGRMMHQTTDGQPLRSHSHPIQAAKSAGLQAFLEAALNPYRQFQADKLGEEWIQELRGTKSFQLRNVLEGVHP